MAKNEGSIKSIIFSRNCAILSCTASRLHHNEQNSVCNDDGYDTVMTANISLRHPISLCECLRSSVTL